MGIEIASQFVAKARRSGNLNSRGVRYTGLALPALPGKLKEVGQASLEAAAQWFNKARMPSKFSVHAYSRYGGKEPNVFEERKGVPQWLVDKYGAPEAMEQGGKIRPLYRSGFLRANIARGTLQTKVTGSGVGMKIRAWWSGLPRYTYMFDPKFKRKGRGLAGSRPLVHDKVRELTMMDARDVEGMRKAYEKEAARQMRNLSGDAA